MDILVALAFAKFDNAPKEVTEAAKAFSDNLVASKKASSQASIWNKAKSDALSKNEVLLKAFSDAMDKWDPAGLNDGKPVEAASAVVAEVKE